MNTPMRLLRMAAAMLTAWGLLLAMSGPATAQFQLSTDSPWPMYNHDLRHSGQTPNLGPLFPSGQPAPTDVKIWQGFDKLKTSLALSPDGNTIYAGIGFDLCAIDTSSMQKKWCTKLDADVSSATPAVAQNGTIYLADRDNSLTAFSPADGHKLFEYNHGREGDIWTSPAIGADGTIYFANNQNLYGYGVVTALNPDGTLKWYYTLGVFANTSSPAIDKNGIIYLGDTTGFLHAFRDNGLGVGCPAPAVPCVDRLWKTQVGTNITASPVISKDSKTLFIGSTNGLSAISIDPQGQLPPGTVLWTFSAGGGIVDQTPALAEDGTLYFGAGQSSLKTIYAINSVDHTTKWTYGPVKFSSTFSAFPIVAGDGVVYVGFNRGVYAFRPTDGAVLWSFNTTNFIISAPIIGGGASLQGGGLAVLYLGSSDWKLYAISGQRSGTATNSPPTAVASANPLNPTVGQTVGFDGSASTDPDHDALSYSWDFGDGTFATGPTPTHAYFTPATYVATLTVSDGLSSDTDQVQVTVTGSPVNSFTDDFNRADSDTLGGPCNQCPQWTEAQGNLCISQGRLKNTQKGNNIAVVPALSGATQTAEADFTSVNNNWGPRLGVVLRLQDAANYYLVYRIGGATTGLRISKVVNGVETVLKSMSISQPVVNTPFHLKGAVAGNTLTLTLGPPQAPTATFSVSDSTFSGGTLGLFLGAGYALQYSADNFVATNN